MKSQDNGSTKRLRNLFAILVCSLLFGVYGASGQAAPRKSQDRHQIHRAKKSTVKQKKTSSIRARTFLGKKNSGARQITLPSSATAGTGIADNTFQANVPELSAFTGSRSTSPIQVATQNINQESLRQSHLAYSPSGRPKLAGPISVRHMDNAGFYALDRSGKRLYFTLDPDLQLKAEALLQRYAVPWGAIVLMEPQSGRVLALASYSSREPEGESVATRASFPAASLFKLITAAAAVEKAGMLGSNVIRFRGGNHDRITPGNFLPNNRKDRRSMSLTEALGKSCNPVFARVGTNYLSKAAIEHYATNFGFNTNLPFDIPLGTSQFFLQDDDYELARTSAGFGEVTMSPLHAALMTATIANRGQMMRPYLIDKVVSANGKIEYRSVPTLLRSPISQLTAGKLLEMMKATAETGTARRHFSQWRRSEFRDIDVAAKTGTLRGLDPEGIYHWFVATAPTKNPQIALAAMVIDPGGVRVKASGLGREMLEYFFQKRS